MRAIRLPLHSLYARVKYTYTPIQELGALGRTRFVASSKTFEVGGHTHTQNNSFGRGGGHWAAYADTRNL
jgi:hypothetical protein